MRSGGIEALRCLECLKWLGANEICCEECGGMGQLVQVENGDRSLEFSPVKVNHQLIDERLQVSITKLKSQLDTSLIACKFSNRLEQKLREEIVEACLDVSEGLSELEAGILKQRAFDEMLGWGPISDLLRDPDVVDIFVNAIDEVLISKRGKKEMQKTSVTFRDEFQLRFLVHRVVCHYANRASEPVNLILPNGSHFFATFKRPRDTAPMVLIFKKVKREVA